jgi:hypothetical protein
VFKLEVEVKKEEEVKRLCQINIQKSIHGDLQISYRGFFSTNTMPGDDHLSDADCSMNFYLSVVCLQIIYRVRQPHERAFGVIIMSAVKTNIRSHSFVLFRSIHVSYNNVQQTNTRLSLDNELSVLRGRPLLNFHGE